MLSRRRRIVSAAGLAALAGVKERGYEGLVAKDEQSTYRGGPTRSSLKVKIRHEGRFVIDGILADASAARHPSMIFGCRAA